MRIVKAIDVAEDVRYYELVSPDGSDLPEFEAGAHLLVRAPNGALRRYSLCNDPHERNRYAIAVKREAAGGGSASLYEETKAGDELLVSAPRNNFALTGNPARYLFVAGGIGITPILSMIRYLASSGGRPFKLYYLCRTPETTAFREDLGAPSFRGKVAIHHDYGDPNRSYDLWPVLEEPKGAHLYCCGPRGLMEAVRDMTGHWSSAAVHFEDFGAGKAARAADDKPFGVRLAKSNRTIEVPAGVTLLEALRAHGHHIASSCESGTCGTCRVGLLAGEADHRDLALADRERAHTILVCVSRARSPELVLDL
ncbi:MAG: PDR/VanB family oxidoreductase [Hyphomicrobiaceae bacterium]